MMKWTAVSPVNQRFILNDQQFILEVMLKFLPHRDHEYDYLRLPCLTLSYS